MEPERIGLIAGAGDLPLLVLDALQQSRKPYFVIPVQGYANDECYNQHPHHWLKMTEIIQSLSLLKAENVSHLMMAGKVERPSLLRLRPFWYSLWMLLRIGCVYFKGDDALFKAVVSVLKSEGFQILGVDEILQDLLAPEGYLTETKATSFEEITYAASQAREFGRSDRGQAVLTKAGKLLATEERAGTAAMIQHHAVKGSVLAKMKKPNQERRVDLPTIGPETIKDAVAAGCSGIVVEAGQSFILHKEEVIKLANEHQLFIYGISSDFDASALTSTR